MNKQTSYLQLLIISILTSCVTMLTSPILLASFVYAQVNDNLPPRETPEPTYTGNLPPREPTSNPSDFKPFDNGAQIELQVQPAQSGLWTIVQWQDGAGNWYDVKNWQGSFNQIGMVLWFVEQKDFNKGPFRWVVYQEQGGALLIISESFYLPAQIGQVVRLDVQLPNLAPSYPLSPPTLMVPIQPYAQPYVQPSTPWSMGYQFDAPEWYDNDPWTSQCSLCHMQ